MFQAFVGDYTYFLTAVLMAIGLYGILAKRNLVKKLIGMNIFQSAIVLFFISGAAKWGGTTPIVDPRSGIPDPAMYVNPLPHVLMLTAIVVLVATTGVALALLLSIYRQYHTLDEQEILSKMRQSPWSTSLS
ncbi:cation:proton antiporter subunit C [Chloroflexota bacterium]